MVSKVSMRVRMMRRRPKMVPRMRMGWVLWGKLTQICIARSRFTGRHCYFGGGFADSSADECLSADAGSGIALYVAVAVGDRGAKAFGATGRGAGATGFAGGD